MRIDKIRVIKIVGTVLGIAGALVAGWVGDKETDRKLEKLVSEQFKKNGGSN